MPTSLTREMFISPNYVKVATSRPTMFKVTAEGTSISQFPVPASVRESSVIPDGYSVDFIFDPSSVVAAFRKRGIITVEQLSAKELNEIKDIINSPKNLLIIPTPLYAQKRALTEQRAKE